MEINEEYDFYMIGRRRALEFAVNLKKQAIEIEKKYGEQAKFEFETGVASVISTYEKITEDFKEVDLKSLEHATTDFGVDNMRNNSYFGTPGTGFRSIPAPTEKPRHK